MTNGIGKIGYGSLDTTSANKSIGEEMQRAMEYAAAQAPNMIPTGAVVVPGMKPEYLTDDNTKKWIMVAIGVGIIAVVVYLLWGKE